MTALDKILQDPQDPDQLSRLAGQTIYDTPVGLLRRVELYRLGNAWGFKFPVGATKDYMLPFFKQIEAQGKNPLRPPVEGKNLDQVVKARDVVHEGEPHSETAPPDEDEAFIVAFDSVKIEPKPKSEFETKLEHLHMGEIRKLCKLRNIPQTPRDRKQDLIARIIAASEGNHLEQDPS